MAKLYTLTGLEVELSVDKRKLARALKNFPPEGIVSKRDAWYVATAYKALVSSPDDSGGETLNPIAEKARLDKARADLAELDLAIKEGRLVPADLVEATLGRLRDEVRKALFAVPGKCAPRILPGMKPSEIEALIREYIDDALRALSSAEVKTETPDDSGSEPSGAA